MQYQATPEPYGKGTTRPVFGIRFSALTTKQLVRRLACEPVPAGEGVRLLATANLDHIVQLTRNPAFGAAYDRAWVATADGAPIYRFARMRGCKLPERVTGADLFAHLMERLSPALHRPFFAIADETIGREIKTALIARGFDPASIAWTCPAFGFEKDEAASNGLAQAIRDHRATHLFFALGAPKSEIWIDRHRLQLGDCYALAIGAAVEFFLGLRQRAPHWVQRIGMEWFWRFAHEPRRLFHRYFVDSWHILVALKRELVPAKASAHATAKGQALRSPP